MPAGQEQEVRFRRGWFNKAKVACRAVVRDETSVFALTPFELRRTCFSPLDGQAQAR